MQKYLKILRISLVERLAYRADFFLTTFFRFLPLITTLLCTTAVWHEVGAGRLAPLDGAALGPLGHLPPGRLRRGLVLGGLSLLILSPGFFQSREWSP